VGMDPAARAEFLIVDDEPLVARTFAKWIEARGGAVQLAGTYAEALQALHAHRAGAVFDLCLPDGSGLELAKHARAAHPDLPVLVVTGAGSAAATNEAQTLGVEFAFKPDLRASFDAFVDRCRTIAASSRSALVTAFAGAHGITPAERRLLEVAVDSTARDYLERALGVTTNTLKTQVRSILGKTGYESLEHLVLPLRVRALRP
jgi:two-component system response regulator DevR